MLAIIPARGGSKEIPRKNIKSFHGKPLIAWTIEAAHKTNLISKIVVSTDSEEIANIAIEYGVEVPFLRPPELATDTAHVIDTYFYTIDRLKTDYGLAYQEIVVLQPTSPLRNYQDIINAISIYKERLADSVISVTKTCHPPSWAKKINTEGVLENYRNEEIDNRNRQESGDVYFPNGAVFILRVDLLRSRNTYYSSKTYPYIMPKERSIDIDDNIDFMIAELLFEKLSIRNESGT